MVYNTMVRVIVFFIFCALISIFDIKEYKIPDCALTGCLSIILAIDISSYYSSIIKNLGALLIIVLIFCLIYKFKGGLGFGDVKMIGLTAYVLGFYDSIMALFLACIFGIIYFLIKTPRQESNAKIAFAPFISLGAFCTVILRCFFYEAL